MDQLLGVLGLGLGRIISLLFVLTLLALWLMGCVYNIPPIRSKDVPYLDVLTEAINNPIRLIAGWFIVSSSTIPPISLVMSYWLVGWYFMALWRHAEYRRLKKPAAAWRNIADQLSLFTAEGLLVPVMFYGSSAMLFFGAFLMRYRLELVLSFPMIALVMANPLPWPSSLTAARSIRKGLYREASN